MWRELIDCVNSNEHNNSISCIVLQHRHNQNWTIKQQIQFLKNAKPKEKRNDYLVKSESLKTYKPV